MSSGYSDDSDDMRDTPDDELGFVPQSGWIALEIAGSVVTGDDPGMSWTKIDDGWRMTYENELGRPNKTDYLPWRIIARDRAGAQTIEDHLSDSNRLTVDGEDPELAPSRQVEIDDGI